MPMIESTPVKVTVTVEVDGHVLTFEEAGKVTGARYHGGDPRENGYSTDDTLEKHIRDTVDSCTAKAARRAETFLRNAYPVAADRTAGVPQ